MCVYLTVENNNNDYILKAPVRLINDFDTRVQTVRPETCQNLSIFWVGGILENCVVFFSCYSRIEYLL